MPPGVFSLIQSTRNDVATALVQHRHTKAVGFTGSLRAGRALFDAAARRPDPIPVYAEMGSVNPVFLLPGALAERAEAIAEGLAASVTLGVGQFCTNPGVVVGIGTDAFDRFVRRMEDLIGKAQPGTMLYPAHLRVVRSGRSPAQRRRRHAHAFAPRSPAPRRMPARCRRCSRPRRRRSSGIESWPKRSSAPRPSSSGAARATRWKPSRAVSTGS